MIKTTPWLTKTSAISIIQDLNEVSSNLQTIDNDYTTFKASYATFSSNADKDIGEVKKALESSANWVNRSELSNSSNWNESYSYLVNASGNISETYAWVETNGSNVIQSANDALKWTQDFISNSGHIKAGQNITIQTANNGIIINATEGGTSTPTIVEAGNGIDVSAIQGGYKVGVDDDYLSNKYQAVGDYLSANALNGVSGNWANSANAQGDYPYVLSGGQWVKCTSLISMFKTSQESNKTPVKEIIYNYHNTLDDNNKYNYIEVSDENNKSYTMYTLANQFGQSFAFDGGITGTFGSDGKWTLSASEGKGSNLNPPTENGEYIYRVSQDGSDWYDISQESSELVGIDGIEVKNENNQTTIGLSGGQLDLSAGQGIGIDKVGNTLVISSNGGDSYYNYSLKNECIPFNEVEGKVYSGYALGKGVIVDTDYMTVLGKYNNPFYSKNILVCVGNGENENNRSNSFIIDVSSNIIGGDDNSFENSKNGLTLGTLNTSYNNSFYTLLGQSNIIYDNDFSTINGYSNKVSAFDNGILNGNSNAVRNCDGNIINGMSNSATNISYSFIAGLGNAMSGSKYSTIYGNGNRVGKAGLSNSEDGNYNYVNGFSNTSLGQFNQLLGQKNYAIGTLNFLVGGGNIGAGQMGMLLGTNNQTLPVNGGMPYDNNPYDGCILMGMGLSANAPMQIIMGARNDPRDKILKVNRDSNSTNSDDYSWPMFVLAGDSNPELPAGSGQNSHTIYKDGQIRLRFDDPNYGIDDNYHLDTVVLNYPYFVSAKNVRDIVSTYSSTFGYLTGSDTVTITHTSNNGLNGYKFEANLEGFHMDDYFKVSSTPGSNSIHVSAQTSEGGKVTYWLSADADGVTNNLDGESGVYVDNSTHKVGLSADILEKVNYPTILYEKHEDGSYSNMCYLDDDGFFRITPWLNTPRIMVNDTPNANGRNWSTTWQKMVLPLSGDIMTQNMIDNGINLKVVPTTWSKTDAEPNTIYLQVEEDN